MSSSRSIQHIAWVLPQFRMGGAELVASQLVRLMREQGIRTSCLSIDAVAADMRDEAARFDVIDLSRQQTGWAARFPRLGRVRRLRTWLERERPDVAIAFLPLAQAVTLWATRRSNIPVMVSERIDPFSDRSANHYRWLVRRDEHRIAGLVVLDPQAASFYPKVSANKVKVIPNPVLPALPCESFDTGRWIVAVGRLEPQKRFDLLLAAFAKALPALPDWNLMIWGAGSQRSALEQLVDQYQLKGRVRLAGQTSAPRRWLPSAASIFALSSDYEGFPNALAEAMAAGMPVIATDCPTGPGTMIKDGVSGLLVPVGDAQALADALIRVGSDDGLKARLGEAAAQQARAWDPAVIAKSWQAAIQDAVHSAGQTCGSS